MMATEETRTRQPRGGPRYLLFVRRAFFSERNFWVDRLAEMANHAPVILVAGNHGAELEGDLLFMCTVILTANVNGWLSGEWKGAKSSSMALSWARLALLIVVVPHGA